MTEHLDVLQASVARLRRTVESLDSVQLEMQAYPAQWTIAEVLSHLGSGAVIFRRRVEDAVGGTQTPGDFAQGVWDAWNAKSPQAKAADALVADRSLVERLVATTDDERSGFALNMGPLTFGFDEFIGMRINEHTLHSWDVEVALDPAATLAPDATEVVVDNLALTARYTAKPTGTEREVTVLTSSPRRGFRVTLGAESVSFEGADPVASPDLEIPAEGLIRLVYGRLDPGHTPPTGGKADLDELRKAFPGP